MDWQKWESLRRAFRMSAHDDAARKEQTRLYHAMNQLCYDEFPELQNGVARQLVHRHIDRERITRVPDTTLLSIPIIGDRRLQLIRDRFPYRPVSVTHGIERAVASLIGTL